MTIKEFENISRKIIEEHPEYEDIIRNIIKEHPELVKEYEDKSKIKANDLVDGENLEERVVYIKEKKCGVIEQKKGVWN